MSLFKKCEDYTEARQVREAGFYTYFRAIESAQDTVVQIDGRKLVMIGSNSYLGLTTDPRVKKAAIEAVEKYGTGCAGSRFLNGTLDIHVELETKLARFIRKEGAQVFSTGFQTNLGTISTLVGKDDVVISDRTNHASIVEGCRLSFGTFKKFKHNDMDDLKRVLAGCDNPGGKLIVVDGVFSMDGDIVKLDKIVELAKTYDARIMVDDAHGIGVLGKTGRGTAEHFGVEDEIDLIMGTFSKTFASLGGFIAGEKLVMDFLRHRSRELVFSASMPPAAVATVSTALDILETEPERREHLWANMERMKSGLEALGFNTGLSETPIIPVVVGDNERTFLMCQMLHDNGVFANAVVSPGVPPGHAMIRTSYMATHTFEQLDRVLEVFEKIGKELGVIQ